MRLLDGITDSIDMNLRDITLGDSEGQRSLACCSAWGCRVRHDLATEQQWHHSVLQGLESSSPKFQTKRP